MNPIDLVPFAEHSQKLPGRFLAPITKLPPFATGSLLFAHGIDFILTVVLSSVMSNIFQESLQNILMTKGLRMALAQQSTLGLLGFVLPTMLLGYFYVSYFMNHGQTLGMLLVKKRIVMSSKDYKAAFKWAAHSMLLCFTFGLSYFFDQSNWKHLKDHDYLYREFVSYKEIAPINLLHCIDEIQNENAENADLDWMQAA